MNAKYVSMFFSNKENERMSNLQYNASGTINGIDWSVKYLGDRDFLLKVGDLTEEYTTMYPMIFGIDVFDKEAINRRLDEMQEVVEKGSNN